MCGTGNDGVMTDTDEEVVDVVVGDGGTGVEVERKSVEDRDDVGGVAGGEVENGFTEGGGDGLDHDGTPWVEEK